MNKIKFIPIFLCLIMGMYHVKTQDTIYDYEWTHDHPILINYVKSNRDSILEWTPMKLNISNQYQDFIYSTLYRENVPKEIIVLAAIESGFRTNVVSRSQAAGMWQFLAPTARDWGLEITDLKDDRMDWKKSTVAAAKYLKWMANTQFDGNYEMAILAYNAGVGRVKRASIELNTTDPWVIIEKGNLSTESKEFLPKFLSYMHYYYYIKNSS